MKLSTRIALAVGASVPLLVLASGWLMVHLVTGDLRAHQDDQLRARATVVAKNAKAYLDVAGTDHTILQQVRRRRLANSARDVGVRLTGPGGTIVAGPQPDPLPTLPHSAPDPVTLTSDGKDWMVLSLRVGAAKEGTTPNLWLLSPDTAEDELSLVRRRVLTGALLAAPLSGVTAWAVAVRAVLPLRRLQRRTSGLDPRTSPARLEHSPTRVAEVDDLAYTVQTVLARYDEQVARTGEALATARAFASTASHELRTPLMSMRTNLDILTDHPDLGAADRAGVLDDLGHEHARLLGLLVMLKALAQGDLIEADAFTSLDLAELVDASVSDLRRTHPEADLSVHAAAGVQVHGWEQGLRSAVDNLLTNAWTHGRAKDGVARIEVTLAPAGDPHQPAAVLTVDDHGPGIPPERREEIFQRFRRGPDSPGSGLGLTLVAQQVALHRGRITVRDRADGRPGTRFEVLLPATTVRDVEHTVPLLRRDWLTSTAGEPPDPRA
ncbi:sensor histidine kinase [Streptomyces olivochromogenes]|uniref:sensor histidine kinase n=1 Tax=Streptomyces olivochromogenes TaxID=1963 RepID=UPI001F408981|nr:HAMP domain-containing sensor histidine kinase [Streptomyces olivochromogenes]MCF3129230.1 HAMP domain-containing histidine kinase [Streptomyces olivochromogenes]